MVSGTQLVTFLAAVISLSFSFFFFPISLLLWIIPLLTHSPTMFPRQPFFRRAFSTALKPSRAHLKPSHPDRPAPPEVVKFLEAQAEGLLSTYARPPLVFTHGKGSFIYDTQDREYLDFSAGIAVNALGHADPEVSHFPFPSPHFPPRETEINHLSKNTDRQTSRRASFPTRPLFERIPQRMGRAVREPPGQTHKDPRRARPHRILQDRQPHLGQSVLCELWNGSKRRGVKVCEKVCVRTIGGGR